MHLLIYLPFKFDHWSIRISSSIVYCWHLQVHMLLSMYLSIHVWINFQFSVCISSSISVVVPCLTQMSHLSIHSSSGMVCVCLTGSATLRHSGAWSLGSFIRSIDFERLIAGPREDTGMPETKYRYSKNQNGQLLNNDENRYTDRYSLNRTCSHNPVDQLLWFSQATYSNSSAAELPSPSSPKSKEMKVFLTQTRTILLLQNACCATDAWRTSAAWAPGIDNGYPRSAFLTCFSISGYIVAIPWHTQRLKLIKFPKTITGARSIRNGHPIPHLCFKAHPQKKMLFSSNEKSLLASDIFIHFKSPKSSTGVCGWEQVSTCNLRLPNLRRNVAM